VFFAIDPCIGTELLAIMGETVCAGMIGASLLDDYLYDPIRTATTAGQVKRLVDGENPPWRATRLVAAWLVKSGADHTVKQALRIKDRFPQRGVGFSR
jgi:hypothetical protein